MKFHIIAMPLVAAACLVMHPGNARSLNQSQSYRETSNASIPFLIYVPDNSPSVTSTEKLQTTKNSGTSTVEIIRSVEIQLNGSDESNSFGIASSDTGDLLFSDVDSKDMGKMSSHRGTRNNEFDGPKSTDILSLTQSETKNEYQQSNIKSSSKRVVAKTMAADGLDFNTRILLGNILIRNYNNDIQDDKQRYFGDRKISDNMYHSTYINQNSSTAFNKSRINVKFPPKMFPLKNVNTQQTRANNTRITNHKIPQLQKAFYRSIIGKKTEINQNDIEIPNTESYNKQKPSEVTPTGSSQTQNNMEKLQALTHWDFGKKTPHAQSNDESYVPISGPSTTPSREHSDISAPNLPHTIYPTRSTLYSLEETTPNSATEKEIKRHFGPKVIPQNSLPQHERVQIHNSNKIIQTLPYLSNSNQVNSPQLHHAIHSHNRNVISKNLGPHLFPNAHVQDYSNHIRSGNVEHENTRTYSSQNHIPVANLRQQSEQQHGERNNWQQVYFVPHVALQRQPQPNVVTLHAVDTGRAAQTVPLVLQQQNPHLYHPALLGTNHAVPTVNGIVYEGVFLTYPQHIQEESSHIVPVLII